MSHRRGRSALVVAVVPLLLLGPLTVTTSRAETDSSAFCARWEQARSALLDEQVENRNEGLQSFEAAADEQLDILDSVDPLVPPGIRTEWDIATDFRRAVTKLILTVDPALFRPLHFELAFGDPDPEAAEAAALDAVAAIDQWTITGCGDFCDRWTEIDRAILGIDDLFFNDPEVVRALEESNVRLLSSIGAIVPDEIRAAWDETMLWRSNLTEAIAANPADPGAVLSTDPVHVNEIGPNLGLNPNEYKEELQRLVQPLVTWVDANCDSATTGDGAPGTLSVTLPLTDDSFGSTVFVAVVEPGSPIIGLESNAEILAGECRPVNESPEFPLEASMIEPRGTRRLCDFFWERGAELVRLDAGTYDVVALTVVGLGDGDLDSFIPAPERCVRFSVVVDGDTRVDGPPLETCSLGPLAGEFSDAESLRAPTVDPAEPGSGTVNVVLPDAISPVFPPIAELNVQDPAVVLAVALASGTELDEVGRREIWPSGAVCTTTFTREFAETRENENDRAALFGPVDLPLLALPATGRPAACFLPWVDAAELIGRPGGLEPAIFARGTYDLYLEANAYPDFDIVNSDARRCYQQQIEVDGNVEIAVPPAADWGACP